MMPATVDSHHASPRRFQMTVPLLSIVIPTYNESGTIVPLLERLQRALASLQGGYEILVVDDASPDGTAGRVMGHARQQPGVQLVQRVGKPDLSSAIADGFSAARGEYLVAMDADGQHDPQAVLRLLEAASAADLVIASRYLAGSSLSGWSLARHWLSRWATRLCRYLLRLDCSDPLSGFFLIRRHAWQMLSARLQPGGFKLLLEILQAGPALRCAETAYHFAGREHGRSKFGFMAGWHFLRAVWRWRRQRP